MYAEMPISARPRFNAGGWVSLFSFQRLWQVGKDTLCVTQITFSQRFKTAEYFANATQNLAKWHGPQQDKRFGKGRYHPNGRRSSQDSFCKNWQPNSQLFLSGQQLFTST